MFPGEDYLHQLNLITDMLGSPTDEQFDFVNEGSALRFLKEMDKKEKVRICSSFIWSLLGLKVYA